MEEDAMFSKSRMIALFVAVLTVPLLTISGALAQVPGGSLDPTTVPKFVDPLVIPPVMPSKEVVYDPVAKKLVNYYEIEVVQFQQQILPSPLPQTTIWSYGAVGRPETRTYPAWTLENLENFPARVKWINNLKDPVTGDFLPHILPIDQTLHWANPAQDCINDMMVPIPGMAKTDCRGQSQELYTGPVPIIPHLHGAHVQPDSDGYPEAWFLPDAGNIPAGYATEGTLYDDIFGGSDKGKGFAVFQYPNDQRETALWYHDHSLGMTRANVYAGPAGFYMIRDLKNIGLGLPGPAPLPGVDPNGNPLVRKLIREIPIVIQDKSFNSDGSLFYPNNRAFFEGLNFPSHPDPQFPGAGSLDIPFIPELALSSERSDVSPIWNPEFFGNIMVVNGKTWPKFEVEKSRYRFRILNACDSRFLILRNSNGLKFWQIGSDGGFLPAPVQLDTLLLGPAERADVIIDFSGVPAGTEVLLENVGPDEPFGGGVPDVDFVSADPGTTGKVMKFIVKNRLVPDLSKRPDLLQLPARTPLGPADNAGNPRRLSLNEDMSMAVCVEEDANGNIVEAECAPDKSNAFGPTSARLGILDEDNNPVPRFWMDTITENPALNSTEIWEIYNFTADAHPIHIHLVQFEIVDRQDLVTDADGVAVPPATLVGGPRPPEPWETGAKDTFIVYPGTVARVKAKFDIAGLYVWHCHILSHEDNEMMRPFMVGPRKELGLRPQLGRKLFFDMKLSSPAGQACASCHMPFAGFADPDNTLPVSQGVLTTAFGTRNAPSAAYAAFSPPFDQVTEVGGQFWDGRARTLKMQAMQPFVNPVEMNNTVDGVVAAVKADSTYVPLFEAVHPGLLATGTDQAIFDAIATDIASYEKSGEVSQFTSKFDAFWRASMAAGIDPLTLNGLPNPAGILTDMEFRGFLLFKSKGKCANCHTLTNLAPNPNLPPKQVEDLPVFTDFKYHNVGSPSVLSNPWYQFPAGFNPPVDPGLAGNPGYTPVTPAYDSALGRFKTPTLRNIAKSMPYGHNGYFYSPDAPTADPVFNSLMMIVHFYSTRDVPNQGWPMWPMNPVPGAPWPDSEITANLNTLDMGNLMLTPDEGMAIVQFMMTLSDGFPSLP
jgi:spore coat protein A